MTSNAQVFRAYRSIEGGAEDLLAWRPMRQGVCDLHRRTEVSQKLTNAIWTPSPLWTIPLEWQS